LWPKKQSPKEDINNFPRVQSETRQVLANPVKIEPVLLTPDDFAFGTFGPQQTVKGTSPEKRLSNVDPELA
jgi:hypothetical protein